MNKSTVGEARGPQADFGDEDREYRLLLNAILATVLLVLVLTMAGQLMAGVYSASRVLLVGVASLVVGWSFMAVRRSIRRGTAILVVGLWLITTLGIIWFAGIYSANILIYAFLIVLSGWILGTRWLWISSVATQLVLVSLGVVEYLGLYQPTPRAPVPIVAGTLVGALVAISFLTAVAYRSLAHRRDRALALSEDLGRQNLEIAQRERDLQLILQQIPVGLTSVDTQFRFRYVNARYAATFGRKVTDLVGKSLLDVVPADQAPALLQRWQACLAGQELKYRRQHTDPATAQTRVLEVTLVPELFDGKVTGMFGLIQDVTDAVSAQENIRELNATLEQRVAQRTAELESAMDTLHRAQEELARAETQAALSTMIASVSHELSTPLGNSLITANTLVDQSRVFGELVQANQIKRSDLQQFVSEVNEGNDLMQRNLQRAAALLKNFRQVATDQASEQRRSFDLADAVREVTQALAPSLRRQVHRVVIDIPEGITMDSYPGALGQLVINLVNNAYSHAFDGVQQGVLTISASLQGDHVLLQFADNGVGMSPELKEKLFEPFFTTKKGRGGTGLGMSIVQNLVSKTLGGSIEVQSEVGKGTTFVVHLQRVAPRSTS